MTSVAERIDGGDARIGVVGLGYVGVPLSLAFVDAGFEVRGFDIDKRRVTRLRNGNSYVDDVSDAELTAAVESGFTPHTDSEGIADCDAYILAVPTGVDDAEPAMGAIKSAAETVAEQAGSRETLVVVSSTVYPGATNEVVEPIVTKHRPASLTHFAMVPERLSPGSEHEIREIPLVVGADDSRARNAAQALFSAITETVPVGATQTAELSKTLENTYRMVNIALVNHLTTLTERLEADVWEAIDAAGTKPFGFQAFNPGPGVGGHCIPVDPQFLTWRANNLDVELSFIEHAHEVNESMPHRVVEGVSSAVEARGTKLEDASILAFGAAYKPNVGDARNSPAIDVFESLRDHTDVALIDPHVDPDEVDVPLVDAVSDETIEAADAVVVLVDHDAFDFTRLSNHATLIYDAKNVVPTDSSATVITLGEAPTRTQQAIANDMSGSR